MSSTNGAKLEHGLGFSFFSLCSSLIFPVRNMNSCRMRWVSEENGERLLQLSPPSVPRLSSRPCHMIPVPTPQTSGHKKDRMEVAGPPVTLQVRDGGQKWQGHKSSTLALSWRRWTRAARGPLAGTRLSHSESLLSFPTTHSFTHNVHPLWPHP